MAESIPIKVDTGQATANIDELAQAAASAAEDFSGLTAMLNEFLKRRSAELGKPVNLFAQDDIETLKAIRAEFQLLVRDTKGSGIGKQLSTQPGGASAVRSPEQINGGLIESDAKKLQATLDKVLMTVLRRVSATTGTSATGLTANELGAAKGTGPHAPSDPADPSAPPGGQTPPRTPKHPDTPLSKSAKVLGYAAQQLSPLAGGAVNQAASMGAEGMAGRGMGGMIAGGGAAGLAAGAGIGLLAAGLFKAASAVNVGIDREKALATDIDKFRRSLGGTADSFQDLSDQSRRVGEGFNLTYDVSRKITTDFANIAKTNKGAVDQASEGVGLAQAVGVDEAQGAGFMASLRKDQSIGDKKSDARMMGVTFAEALKRTGSTLNASELMSAMQGFSSDTAHRSLTVGNVEGYAGMLSAMVGSKTPGLDVGNSRSLMARADASFQGGGGAGQASSTLQYMALGGDRLGLMGVKMREAAGMMATNDQVFGNPDNPVNKYTGGQMLQNKGSSTGLEDLIKLIKENSGGNRELEINTLANHLKLNPNEAATFLNMENQGKLGDTLAMSRQYKGVDLNKMSSDGYSMLADVAVAKGDDGKLAGVRDGLSNRADLTKDQKSQIDQMRGLSGEKLQDALVKFSTTLEREKTKGEEIEANAAKTANATDRMATLLVPATIEAKNLLSALVEKLAPDTEAGKKILAEKKDDELQKMRVKVDSGEMSEKAVEFKNLTYRKNDSMLSASGAPFKDRVKLATDHIQELGEKAVPHQVRDGKNPKKEQEDAAVWAEAQAAAKTKAAESMARKGVDPAAQAPKSPASTPAVPGEVRRKSAAELAGEAASAAQKSDQSATGTAAGDARAAINKAGEKYGINPDYLAGLAKLETRMGEKSIKGGGEDTKNLFNVKGNAGNGIRAYDSAEGSNDYYRKYGNYDESADAVGSLLARKYPGATTAKTPEEFATALKKGGYATDPNYVSKLTRTIGQPSPSPSPAPTDSSRGIFAATDPRRSNVTPQAAPVQLAKAAPVPKAPPETSNAVPVSKAPVQLAGLVRVPKENPERKSSPMPAPTDTSRGIFAAAEPRRIDDAPIAAPIQIAKPVPIPAGNPQSTEQAKAEQQRVNVAFASQKHSIDVNVHSGSGTDRQEQSHQLAWVSKPKASGTLAMA